jgi:hypothetical protein
MTRQQHYIRAAITMTNAALVVLVLAASPASAGYRAWYGQGGTVGQFVSGDVSEDQTKMIPPPGACGLKMISPSSYRWADGDENTVQDDYGNDESGPVPIDAIIWVENAGCTRPFSVNYSPGNPIDFPENGAAFIEILDSDGAHWVNEEGCHLTGCGGVDPGADDEAIQPGHYWSLAVVSAFKAVTPSVIDPRRQPRAVTAIGALSHDVAQLQPVLQNLIADRRRLPLGVVEASVRGLEDAATKALTSARSSVAACETRARQGAYADAFIACTTAGRYVEHSGALIRTAMSISMGR